MQKIDLVELIESLTSEDIIALVTDLGADQYNETTDYIVFPTICHNISSEDASMKLYYYKNTHLFVCYTECDSSFNIFTLFEKVYRLHNRSYSFSEILNTIVKKTGYEQHLTLFGSEKYKGIGDKYKKKSRSKEVEIYDKKVLNVFTKKYPIEWILEGITEESMDKYNILYSISRNKIIIPHYNIDGELIGIRGRTLDKEEEKLFGKYMPVEIENKWYSSPLSLNLYGIDKAKEGIKKKKKVIIVEGEKSVLQYDRMYQDNICVATCGRSINKSQINLLIKNFDLTEIIIAFDKEYKEYWDEDCRRYFNKLNELCKKYNNYCNFSFIFDKTNLLKEKDSPLDRGKKIFEELYNNRIKVGNF